MKLFTGTISFDDETPEHIRAEKLRMLASNGFLLTVINQRDEWDNVSPDDWYARQVELMKDRAPA